MRFALSAVSAAAFVLLTVAGCSEPVPQSSGGAFFLATIQDNPVECSMIGHTVQVGTIDASNRGVVVIDGTDMTRIDCTVESIAGTMTPPYRVKGKIDAMEKSGNYMEILISSIDPSAKIDAPAAGSITFSDPKTAGLPYGGPCNFYFEQPVQTVAEGRIWVSFDCPALKSGMSTCPLKKGYAIFENCLSFSTSD